MTAQMQSKSNLIYFESSSMRELYESLEAWQNFHQKRFLSLSVQKDKRNFCCIALTDHFIKKQTLKTEYQEEIERFERKALKKIGVGVGFVSLIIPPEKVLAIQSKLKDCKTEAEVRAVFRWES